MSAPSTSVSPAPPWSQIFWITAAAIALYVGMRLLPTGTNLSHMDFRVDPRGGNAIEFCDPSNPQFIPVVAARSPVALVLSPSAPARAGHEAVVTLRLHTSSGKPVTPADLLVTHTRPLHLLIVDPSLADYQHVHPEPGARDGEWTFAFTPRAGGTYRVFGDFTPAATARGLYASADLVVAGEPLPARRLEAGDGPVRYALAVENGELRAGEPGELRFSARRVDGQPLALEPVMGAYAHLVAFDPERSGFAHLHPLEDESVAPDPVTPNLRFRLTMPRSGAYVIWAQVKVAGEERFVPFTVEVKPV